MPRQVLTQQRALVKWARYGLYPGKSRTWTMMSIGRVDVGDMRRTKNHDLPKMSQLYR